MNILVTNDDGIDSPLLHALVKALKVEPWVDEVWPIVPFCEKSWIAGAVSRHGTRNIKKRSRPEGEYLFIDGTPADCTSIGIGNIYKDNIDLVISGINFGVNAGIAFHTSSGTVAGARQAALFGIPGVAASTAISSDIMTHWKERDFKKLLEKEQLFDEIAKYQVDVISRMLDLKIFSLKSANYGDRRLDHTVEFASLNAPVTFSDSPPVVSTLSNTRFNPIFIEEKENVFRHKYQGFARGDNAPLNLDDPEDISVLLSGRHSLTLFNLEEEAQAGLISYKERNRHYQRLLDSSYSKS